mmetsp:Transcript_15210/g.39235  ORF Transcript_15210/g.39235 Transcript_15210/m.39235 type:complete len:261 (-) Transcript_15210:46-828(-)
MSVICCQLMPMRPTPSANSWQLMLPLPFKSSFLKASLAPPQSSLSEARMANRPSYLMSASSPCVHVPGRVRSVEDSGLRRPNPREPIARAVAGGRFSCGCDCDCPNRWPPCGSGAVGRPGWLSWGAHAARYAASTPSRIETPSSGPAVQDAGELPMVSSPAMDKVRSAQTAAALRANSPVPAKELAEMLMPCEPRLKSSCNEPPDMSSRDFTLGSLRGTASAVDSWSRRLLIFLLTSVARCAWMSRSSCCFSMRDFAFFS